MLLLEWRHLSIDIIICCRHGGVLGAGVCEFQQARLKTSNQCNLLISGFVVAVVRRKQGRGPRLIVRAAWLGLHSEANKVERIETYCIPGYICVHTVW